MDPRWVIPLMLLAMLVLLIWLLRWTFGGRSRTGPTPPPATDEAEYAPVRQVPTFVEAEIMRLELRSVGVAAEVGRRAGQATVLVHPRDLARAETILSGYPD